jgi:hypothetical protein
LQGFLLVRDLDVGKRIPRLTPGMTWNGAGEGDGGVAVTGSERR